MKLIAIRLVNLLYTCKVNNMAVMFPANRSGKAAALLLIAVLVCALCLWGLTTQLQRSDHARMLHISRQIKAIGDNASSAATERISAVLGGYLHDCGGIARPARTTRFRNNVWHMDTVASGDVMVFSAFYDDRSCFGGKVYIRLLVVTNVKPRDNLVCQIWYGDNTNPLISRAISEDTGRGLNQAKVHYQERLYSCEIPKIPSMYPDYVSLQEASCQKSSMLVPVVVPEKKAVHDLGICVVVAYGDLDPKQLIEWVELNRILGVGEINVYDSRVKANAKRVFEYYREKGIMLVHPAAPSVDDWCKWCQKLTAIASLNDCMYRNMYRYRHLIVIDFDEFIIPTKFYKLREMLSTVRKTWKEEPAGYLFRNTYFFLDIKPKYTTPEYLRTPRFVNRQSPSEIGYSPKSIIDPRRCMVMQNHYCMKRAPDVSGNFALSVKPEHALSHHYKLCHFSKAECKKLISKTSIDESVRRYATELNSTVFKVLQEMEINV